MNLGGLGMANLNDLNTILFNQLNRLDSEELKGEEMKDELDRARTITLVADKVIQNGHLVLQAAKFKDDMWNADAKVPKMLEAGKDD